MGSMVRLPWVCRVASVVALAACAACGPPPSRLGVSPDVTERTKGPLSDAESAVLQKHGPPVFWTLGATFKVSILGKTKLN